MGMDLSMGMGNMGMGLGMEMTGGMGMAPHVGAFNGMEMMGYGVESRPLTTSPAFSSASSHHNNGRGGGEESSMFSAGGGRGGLPMGVGEGALPPTARGQRLDDGYSSSQQQGTW